MDECDFTVEQDKRAMDYAMKLAEKVGIKPKRIIVPVTSSGGEFYQVKEESNFGAILDWDNIR